jgi:hypothetical protein
MRARSTASFETLAAKASPVSPALHAHPAALAQPVKRWFAMLMEKQIRRGSFQSTRHLKEAIREHTIHNAQPHHSFWTKSADEILNTLARFCRRTNDSGH